jgi:hypothetical protein
MITAKEISELKHPASVILTCDQVDDMAELCLKQAAEIERLRGNQPPLTGEECLMFEPLPTNNYKG